MHAFMIFLLLHVECESKQLSVSTCVSEKIISLKVERNLEYFFFLTVCEITSDLAFLSIA